MDSSHGGIGRPLLWTTRERLVWTLTMFVGMLLLYAGRTALPVGIVKIAVEKDWNKRTSVSLSLPEHVNFQVV